MIWSNVFVVTLTSLILVSAWQQSDSTERRGVQLQDPEHRRLDGVLLELSGPGTHLLPWAASEWALTVVNLWHGDFPFSARAVGSGGSRGVQVYFEVTHVTSEGSGKDRSVKGEVVGEPELFRGNPFLLTGDSLYNAHSPTMPLGSRVRVPMTLHGRMRSVLERRGNADNEGVSVRHVVGPGSRFSPAFIESGAYRVRVKLTYDQKVLFSNPISVEVSACPPADQMALERYRELAESGLCLDFRNHPGSGKHSLKDLMFSFLRDYQGSLYGHQMALGRVMHLVEMGELYARMKGPRREESQRVVQRVCDEARMLVGPLTDEGTGLGRSLGEYRTRLAALESRLKR